MDDMCHSADERMLNRAVSMLTGTGGWGLGVGGEEKNRPIPKT